MDANELHTNPRAQTLFGHALAGEPSGARQPKTVPGRTEALRDGAGAEAGSSTRAAQSAGVRPAQIVFRVEGVLCGRGYPRKPSSWETEFPSPGRYLTYCRLPLGVVQTIAQHPKALWTLRLREANPTRENPSADA